MQGQGNPRGFYVTSKDLRGGQWSDPVYYDQLGIDQDVSLVRLEIGLTSS